MRQPVNELVVFRLQRAEETLAEAKIMAASECWNGCVNRLYYACFHAVNAMLLTKGLSSSKHSGVRSLFSLHFVKTSIIPKEMAALFNTLFDARQESDYEDFFNVDPDEATPWLKQVEEFIQFIQGICETDKP